MAPFLCMSFICRKATESLRGDRLFFNTDYPGVPGTYLINLGRMKDSLSRSHAVVLNSGPLDRESGSLTGPLAHDT